MISLQNRTFDTANVPLNFTVNEPVSTISYSLDGNGNITFTNVVMAHIYGKDNYYFVLNNLEDGSHSLKIYGKDAAGYTGESETYYFTVNTQPKPTPSSSPTPTATAPPSSAEMPSFNMPKEYLNYTITTRDGAPWAVIEGVYPIYCSNADKQDTIAMVYPTPPGTTNISIKLNGVLLNWSDFAEQYPDALHHTAIGDWSMIGTAFEPSSNFVLSIHYEHPIMQANGSYQFLYDLNISPYLSASSPSSTASFTLKIDDAYSNIKVFTVPSDSIRNPMEYVSQRQGGLKEITFAVTSEYAKTLPGDVIVTFDEANNENQSFPTPTVAVVLGVALFVAAVTLLVVVLARRKKRSNTSVLTDKAPFG